MTLKAIAQPVAPVEELQQCLKHRLNPLFKIHALEAIAKLPRTASNKIMRRELRTMYLEKNCT